MVGEPNPNPLNQLREKDKQILGRKVRQKAKFTAFFLFFFLKNLTMQTPPIHLNELSIKKDWYSTESLAEQFQSIVI